MRVERLGGFAFAIKDREVNVAPSLATYFCPYLAAQVEKLSKMDYARLVRRFGYTIRTGQALHKLIEALDPRCVKEPMLRDEELKIGGKPDFLCLDESGTAAVIEFKSELNDAWLEAKLWTLRKYMALAARKYNAEAAVGALYGILDGKHIEITLTRRQLDAEYEDLRRRVESARSPTPAKTRGPWCAHCVLRAKCRAKKPAAAIQP